MTQLDDIKKRYEQAHVLEAWKQHGENFRYGRTIWSGERRLFGNQHECTEAEFDLVLHSPTDIGYLLRLVKELGKELTYELPIAASTDKIAAAHERAEKKR